MYTLWTLNRFRYCDSFTIGQETSLRKLSPLLPVGLLLELDAQPLPWDFPSLLLLLDPLFTGSSFCFLLPLLFWQHTPASSFLKRVGMESFFSQTCIYEKCFILLSCLIDNLAAFTMIVSKPFILRILRELLYHLLDLNVVAKKSNAFIFLDAFYVTWFISFLEGF